MVQKEIRKIRIRSPKQYGALWLIDWLIDWLFIREYINKYASHGRYMWQNKLSQYNIDHNK